MTVEGRRRAVTAAAIRALNKFKTSAKTVVYGGNVLFIRR